MTYWQSVMLVIIGACSYGILSIFMKFAFNAGFTPYELSGSQLIFGGLIMSVMALFFSRERFRLKHLLILAPVSLMMASTSLLYHQAVSRVSTSLAIVLLFQFTWIGVLLESIADRKWPSAAKWVSVAMLGGGTILSSGLGENGLQNVSMAGLVCGLLSGFAFAMVIFFSGWRATHRKRTGYHPECGGTAYGRLAVQLRTVRGRQHNSMGRRLDDSGCHRCSTNQVATALLSFAFIAETQHVTKEKTLRVLVTPARG